MRFAFALILVQSLFFPFATARSMDSLTIHLRAQDCNIADVPLADGRIPSPTMVAKDAYCARELLEKNAPWGAITVFGSARAKPGSEYYQLTLQFAQKWTAKYGRSYPILTGGGPGIMEAANRGAFLANGKSLGIATRFSTGQEKANDFVTDSYMAGSFSQREADLIDYAAVIVVAPGGFGTEWEIYEALSKIQTQKKSNVIVILLGQRSVWSTLLKRLELFRDMGTINPKDLDLIVVAEDAEQAIRLIESKLFNRS